MFATCFLIGIWIHFLNGAAGAATVTALASSEAGRSKRDAFADPTCVVFTAPADHFANGEYVRDDSLLDCSQDGKPRYKHRTLPQYLYSYYDPIFRTNRWQQAGSVICIPWFTNFFSDSAERSPLNTIVGSWREGFMGFGVAGVAVSQCDIPFCMELSMPSPFANDIDGKYIRDDSLTDCSGGTRPRYKHKSKNQYLFWMYDGLLKINRWQQATSILCISVSAYFCVSNAYDPAETTASCWKDLLGATKDINVTSCPYACHPNPCVHGICSLPADDADNSTTYTCKCDVGWYGTNCDKETLECASNPCQNGGKCVEQTNSFRCECPIVWSGDRCAIITWWNPLVWVASIIGIADQETSPKALASEKPKRRN